MSLGEVVNGKGERWELQLKGAGSALTPKSIGLVTRKAAASGTGAQKPKPRQKSTIWVLKCQFSVKSHVMLVLNWQLYLTQRFFKAVLQKLTPPQIRELILYYY